MATPEDQLVIEVKDGGKIHVDLMPQVAPNHVARIKELTREGFYDGRPFHRVIDGFMAQTGCPRGDGTGGSDKPNLAAEFNAEPFDRGVLGMARAQHPDSANSQFFIMFDEGHFLNGQYTVFGKVTQGMEHVDAIKKGSQAANGAIDGEPDKMISVKVAADL